MAFQIAPQPFQEPRAVEPGIGLGMAEVAGGKLKAGANGEAAFYEAKLDVGRFFMARVLPRHSTHFQGIMAGGETLVRMKAEAF